MFVATYNPYLLILVVFVLTWSFQLSLFNYGQLLL